MNFVFFFFLCWGVGHTGIVLRLLFYCLSVNMYLYAHRIIIAQHCKED